MNKHEILAAEILDFFSSRGGFCSWWDSIDARTQVELMNELKCLIKSSLSE